VPSTLKRTRQSSSLHLSSPHDVNGEDAALMTREQVIDEVADDGVWFISKLRHDPANEDAGASMPFEIDHAMGFAGAVDFCPAMRTARPLVFGRHQSEFPLELRIAHDLVAQRSVAARDDLNHRLHRLVGTPRRGVRGQRSALSLPFARLPRILK